MGRRRETQGREDKREPTGHRRPRPRGVDAAEERSNGTAATTESGDRAVQGKKQEKGR